MSNSISAPRAAADPWQASSPTTDDAPIALADNGQERNVRGNVSEALKHLSFPDAVVYTNDALNRPSTRNFVLANPLTGSYTHFITHKNQTVNVHGTPFKHVEAIHYDANGGGTRREDGLGWAKEVGGGVTVFANRRGGDTNLIDDKNGVSINAGFFASPEALRGKGGIIDKMEKSPDARLRTLAKGLDGAASVMSAGGSQVGVAWRGEMSYDKTSKELQVNIGGAKFSLAEFAQVLEKLQPTNEGHRGIAEQNNREAYLDGANPYAHADKTRAPDGEYRNHGDPIAAISASVVQLGEVVNPGQPPVRTNDQARQVLEEAIDRDYPELSADQRRLLGEDAQALRPDRLGDARSAQLHSTLSMMDEYGLSFGSPKIEQAAEDAARAAGAKGPPRADPQFVRDVFEGDFRTDFAQSYGAGDAVSDVLVGANRWLAAILGADGGPIARDEVIGVREHEARQEGLRARLEAIDGGVLDALGLSAADLSAEEKAEYERAVLSGVANAMDERVQAQNIAPSGQSLYEAFDALSDEERASLGARLNAAAREQLH